VAQIELHRGYEAINELPGDFDKIGMTERSLLDDFWQRLTLNQFKQRRRVPFRPHRTRKQ